MPATNVQWPPPLVRQNSLWPGQFGVPGTDSRTGLREHSTGATFYVDPNFPGASDSRDGTDPTAPLLSVTAALTHCEPYRGDTIAVMHNGLWTFGNMLEDNIVPIQETVTINVPGVRLVGVSPSPLGVPWIPTANGDVLITVNALDVLIEGFNFWAFTYGLVTGIHAPWSSPALFGENLTVRHCYFYGLDYGLQLDYSWNDFVTDCQFMGMTTAAIHNPSVYGEPDYLTIHDNVFRANAADINLPDCDNALIEDNRFFDVSAAIAMLAGNNNQIIGNVIQGDGAGVNNFINLTGGANNVVSDNTLTCTIVQYDTCNSDATSGMWGGNRCSDGFTAAAPT